jgi:hypothetical protein
VHAVDPERDRIETISAFLLGLATVASAVCAYRATLWSGEQIRSLTLASARQFESLRQTTAASRERIVDVTSFVDLLQAAARGDARTATFVRERLRGEFRPALEAWIRGGDRARPEAGHDAAAATQLQTDAALAIDAAHRASANSDLLALHSVFLALALFFLGLTLQVRTRALRRAMLVFGTLVLFLGVISMMQVPGPIHGAFLTAE